MPYRPFVRIPALARRCFSFTLFFSSLPDVKRISLAHNASGFSTPLWIKLMLITRFGGCLRKCLIALLMMTMAGCDTGAQGPGGAPGPGQPAPGTPPPAQVSVSGRITYDRVPEVERPEVKLDYTRTTR